MASTIFGGHGQSKRRRICKGSKKKFRRQMRANANDGMQRKRAGGLRPARQKSAKGE